MAPIHRRFDGLDHVIDEIHRLCAELEDAPETVALDVLCVQVLKLAIHEWMANLVQHARFGTATPAVELLLIPEHNGLRVIIDDNSEGFDLSRQIERQQYLLDAAPEPPERGRGLLMMTACTQGLDYTRLDGLASGDGCPSDMTHRLEFRIASLDLEPRRQLRHRQIPFTSERAATPSPTLSLR